MATMKLGGGSAKCACCEKAVYKLEELQVDKAVLHKSCFKCSHCNRQLTLSNFAAVSNKFYCKTHFIELFHSAGGKYSVFGGDEFKMKESGAFASMVPQNSSNKTAAAAAVKSSPPTSSSAAAPPKKVTSARPESSKKESSTASEKPASAAAPVFKADDSCRDGSPEKKSGKYLSLKQRMQLYQRNASNSTDEAEEDEEEEEHDEFPQAAAPPPAVPAVKIKPAAKPQESVVANKPAGKLPSRLPSSLSSSSQDTVEEASPDLEQDEDEDVSTEHFSASVSTSIPRRANADASVDATSPTRSRTTSISDLVSSISLNDPAQDMSDDVSTLQRQLSEAREALRLLHVRADSLKEDNERLTEANVHLKKELAVQTAKALESDEWCAKLSQDLKSLKTVH